MHFTNIIGLPIPTSSNTLTGEISMKNLLLVLTAVLVSTQAQADGFLCSTDDGLNIKVYNHTSGDKGTRSVAKMIVSDDNVGFGNKTIATFSDAQSLVASHKQTYIAKVDLRFGTVGGKGELIGGTKLGELSHIILSVDFMYSEPTANGEHVNGVVTLQKRNGEEIIEFANCTRYLKN